MKRILITGGRNPTALELVRLLAGKQTQIFLSDSLNFPVGLYSIFVSKYLQTPRVALNPQEYISFLRREIIKHQIDLLIPTYEEIFYIAQYKHMLVDVCEVFCDDFEKLISFHDKYSFSFQTSGLGIEAPEGYLFNNPSELAAYDIKGTDFIFKPIYSRFATKTLICPNNTGLKRLKNNMYYPWMAQKFVKGKEYCSYSIVNGGIVKAHVTYDHSFLLGKGSGIYFGIVQKPEIEAYVQEFCMKHDFHGQIAFDFIEEEKDGKLYVIECNPRTVSGLHLYSWKDNILEAFMGQNKSILYPSERTPKMNGLTFFTYNAVKAVKNRNIIQWFLSAFKADDVIFKMYDPLPFIGQILTLLEFICMALKYRVSLGDAISFDIAWNSKSSFVTRTKQLPAVNHPHKKEVPLCKSGK